MSTITQVTLIICVTIILLLIINEIGEYLQAKIRYDKLDTMTVKYEAGTLLFTPSCSLELLKEQKKHMGNYIRCLRIRAEIEGIELGVNN